MKRKRHYNNMLRFPTYHVTGVTIDGKRFKIVTKSIMHASAINLWRGTVWGVKKDGTRCQLWQVFN